ncbi:hypothetical protein EV43_15620, partial [Staphylococcus aureus]
AYMSNVQNERNNVVTRGLKDRHISMLAIGGCIGKGLFVTSGGAHHDSGTLGALLGYAIIGLMGFCLITLFGEMAKYLPVSGTF